jgi:LuxR family maltose regulon positive regulatory protein
MGDAAVDRDQREHQLLGFAPLGSRLRPPRAQVELFRRRTLVEELLQTTASLVLVSAPAGAGKSTALAQWTREDPRPTAWLQLDEADDDPVVLLSYLTVSLAGLAPVDLSVLDLLQLRHPPIDERILPSLAASVAAAPPFLLVLDDGHLISNGASWRVIEVLLGQLPAGAQVALGSRADPPLPMARLRAAGQLSTFRMDALAMDRDEARQLLELNDCRVEDDELDALLTLTEGWATGLYLAVIAGQGRKGSDWLPRVHGDQREIAGYLTTEVLNRQPQNLREFLLSTSILDRLSPALCLAVSGRDDAHELLARLARENLFVNALDERDEWYRYHHLFGELLRVELERREPRSLPGLHQRAAEWHHLHGDPEVAIRHWLDAGDLESAAEPTFCLCQDLVYRGQVETARRLLDRFTEEQIRSQVPLTLAAGWLYGTVIGDPDRGGRWLRAVCAGPAYERVKNGVGGSWHSFQLYLRAFLAPDGMGPMQRDAEDSYSLEKGVPGADLSEVSRVLGVACYLSGHPRRSARLFADVVDESDLPSTRAYALAFLALIAADENRWDDAADFERRSSEQSPAMTLDISPGMYLALPMLLARVSVLAHLGDPGLTAEQARAARHLEQMIPQVPWRIILAAVVFGEVALAQGDLAEAERWTIRAERTLTGYPDAGMLVRRVGRLRQMLEQLRLTDPLTPAERHVLELLPTQLTAAQIAARLFVSTNTAKTHMRHLYAKLDVTTRTDAVDRARRLGLLAPADEG